MSNALQGEITLIDLTEGETDGTLLMSLTDNSEMKPENFSETQNRNFFIKLGFILRRQ